MRRALTSALILLSLLFMPPVMASEIRVGVMTMQPGGIFWERFGHNAIVIEDGVRFSGRCTMLDESATTTAPDLGNRRGNS